MIGHGVRCADALSLCAFRPTVWSKSRGLVAKFAATVRLSMGPMTHAEPSLLSQLPSAPALGLILGSGLGDFADTLDGSHVIPYESLPDMPRSHVTGHAGRFVYGHLDNVPLIAMQGRVHMYEGWTAQQVVRGVNAMLDAGAQALIVTNAAGGIRRDFPVGSLMLIEDHINLTGQNCLCGENDTSRGPRFPDMSRAYCPRLRELVADSARNLGLHLERGVYAGVLGPSYETPAEIRMLRTLGADAVGMSTVQEVIAARHRGARCLGLSCITNAAADSQGEALSHADVQATAQRVKGDFSRLLRAVIPAVADETAKGRD